MSHSPAAIRQVAPALPAGCWQVTFVPSHWSFVHGFVSAVHAVPLAFFASVTGQVAEVPVQTSATSHSPPAIRHVAPALPAGCWQVVLVPLHVSAVHALPSSGPAAPAFPAGCWQVTFVPSQRSAVHGLPSSVHAAPFVFFASVAGQVA